MNDTKTQLNNVRKAASDVCDLADERLWRAIAEIPDEGIREAVSAAFRKDRDKLFKMVFSTIAKCRERPRFVPAKRHALNGKIHWAPWDNERNCFSTMVCHGYYKTRRECQYAIEQGKLKGFY